MRLLLDEGVPASVASVFSERGHRVDYVWDYLPRGAEDHLVAATADQLQAIIVSWDKDFKNLIRRTPGKGGKISYPAVGRISLRCDEAAGAKRLAAEIQLIEAAYTIRSTLEDARLIVEVQADVVRFIS